MRSWRLHRERQPVMVLLAECAHWSMELLDAEGEAATAAGGQALLVVQRRKRVVRKTRRVKLNGAVASVNKSELAEALPARVITAKGKKIRRKGKKKKQEEEQQAQQATSEATAAAAAAQPEPQQEEHSAAGTESSGGGEDGEPMVDDDMQEREETAIEQGGVTEVATAALLSDAVAAVFDSVDSSADTLLQPQSPSPSSAAVNTEADRMADETSDPATSPAPLLPAVSAQVDEPESAVAAVTASQAETQLEAMMTGTQPAQDELATQLLAMEDDDVETEQETSEGHLTSASVLSEAATQLVVQDSSETAEGAATLVVAETPQQLPVPSSVDASTVSGFSSSPSSLSTLVSAMGIQATQLVPDSLTLTEAAQSDDGQQLAQSMEASDVGGMDSVVLASIEDQLELQPDVPEEQEQVAPAQELTAETAASALPAQAAPVLATVVTSSTPQRPEASSSSPLPSDDAIRTRLHSLLSSADLNVTTSKKLRQQLEGEFAADLSSRKGFISQLIDDFINSGSSAATGRVAEKDKEMQEEDEEEGEEEEEEEEAGEKKAEQPPQPVVAESGDAAGAAAGGDGEAGVEYEEVEEEEEVDDPEVSEDGYVRRESAFNFTAYLLSYAQPIIVSHYLQLLSAYATNSPQLNALIVSFLSRIAFDRELLPMLYQLSFLQLADTVLQDARIRDRPQYRPVRSFCKKVVRAFFDACAGQAEAAGAAAGGVLFAKCLFWKSVKDVELIKSGYRGREKEDFNDRQDQQEAAEAEDRKDGEQEWKAEGQPDEDGDWKPEQQQSDTAQQVQTAAGAAAPPAQAARSGKQGQAKEKKPRKKRAKAAGSEQAGSEQRQDAAVSAAEEDDGDGEEIDLDGLMNEQKKKDKARQRREKAEDKRKAAEARERERERQRRALLDHSDDDEEELQLGEYSEDRDGGQQPLSPLGDDRSWTAQDEELLRREIPIFAALRTKYLLVIPKLSAVWSEDEVRRKVEAMGILTADTGAPQQQPELRVPETESHATLHVQTTDDDSSEQDSSSGALDSSLSPANAAFAAPSASSSSSSPAAAPLALQTAAPASIPRGRAPSGASIDVKRITARLYDIIASLTRRPAYHPLISALLSALAACAEERTAETADYRAYLLNPAEWAGVEAGGDELWRRGVLRLMSALQVSAQGSRRWTLQRQYTAEKLQAVAAVVERAFENTKEDIAAGRLSETAADDDDDEEEEEEERVERAAQADSETAAGQAMEDAEDAAEALERRAAREEREAIANALPRRETRKRKEAASASSQPQPQFVRAEDELDNAELAQFLREKRNRLQLMHQQQLLLQQLSSLTAAAAAVAAANEDVSSSHRRLRKIAETDSEEAAEQAEDRHRQLQPEAERGAVDRAAPVATAAVAVSTKRRKVLLLDDDDDDDDAVMQ